MAADWRLRSLDDITDSGSRELFIRHDIDAELYLLDPFLDIEKTHHITATYFLMLESSFYNLWSREGRAVIDRIGSEGHSFGLHFFGELHSSLTPKQLEEEIEDQVDRVSRLVGSRVGCFSFHQPTRQMIDLNLDLPGIHNMYHESTMRELTYVSDTNMDWRPCPPHEIIQTNSRRIQLLIHPLWWIMDDPSPAGRWRQLLRAVSSAQAKHLLARERTLSGVDINALVPDDLRN